MPKTMKATLLTEEHRAAKLFLILFYVITVCELLLSHISSRYGLSKADIIIKYGIGMYIYFILLGLLPIAIYFFKTNNPGYVKYLYFCVYTFVNIINETLIYEGNQLEYQSGSAVELLLVLFSPLFINKGFLWLVTLGTILKYAVVGIFIHSPKVIIPIILVAILSLIAFILLDRFAKYVTAIKDSYDANLETMVRGIVSTLELKDPYTRGHSERVADYALLLAESVGTISGEQLKIFKFACLLHDIGKIHIPDYILLKPDKLTADEFQTVQTHTVLGAKALESVDGLENCIDVIRHHHERWDGQGYPDQLRGSDISLLARITSIADAFDAMTSTRSYRSALAPEEAMQRIVEGKGTQFDPELVELFVELFPKWMILLKNMIEYESG